MKISTNENSRGFTIIETLLSLSIVIIVLGILTMGMGVVIDGYLKQRTVLEVEREGTRAVDVITQTLRNAKVVTIPAAGATSTEIVLINAADEETSINVSGGRLRIKEGGANYEFITSDNVKIASTTFTNYTRPNTPGLFQLIFTLSYLAPAGGEGRTLYNHERQFRSAATLR